MNERILMDSSLKTILLLLRLPTLANTVNSIITIYNIATRKKMYDGRGANSKASGRGARNGFCVQPLKNGPISSPVLPVRT